jgi:transcriptional regulator with XRE-family HTH domain
MLGSVQNPTPTQIKAARALLGWSQRELAKRAGVALSTVADFERGFRGPIPNNLQALVKVLTSEGIRIGRDGSVRGRPPGGAPLAAKGRTLFRFVDETGLRRWAATRDCQGRLPELLTRLIRAEKGHDAQLRFPSGDAIALHGWDGRCRVRKGTAYIPAGVSGWEISAQTDNLTQKAEGVFRSRTEAPKGINPAASAFVFATPCRWPGKDDWVEEKKAAGAWADVRAYDAVDLVHWIEMNPAVGYWLAVVTGSAPPGLRAIETVWEEWSQSTEWPMSADLVLAGRDEEATRVLSWLYGDPAAVAVHGESPDEAVSFLFAALHRLPPDYRMPYLARCLIAREPDQARALGQSPAPLIIGLENANPGLARWLVGQGHHVYSVFGSEVGVPRDVIRLPRALRIDTEAALVGMGLRDEAAREAARDMAGSIAVLRRVYPSVASRLEPNWASPDQARKMIPALIAGAWDESEAADRAKMERLGGVDYETMARELTPWLTVADSPLRKSGSVWKLASPRDALFRLAPYVTDGDMKVFAEVAGAVLGASDPRYDLPGDERWYAAVTGQMPEHSEFLASGLSETMMALAIFGARAGLADARATAASIVQNLMDGADARRWWSVHRHLELFAEAAPEVFLDAVEASLTQNDPPILALFTDDRAPFTGGIYYADLLWGLERLGWSPKYLRRVALLLARLALATRIESRHENRPSNSLRNLFLLWRPQTYATLAERLDVLDRVLRRHEPGVAWSLMWQLVPHSQDMMLPSSRPRWRDFSDGRAEETVTGPLWAQGADEIAKRLLEDVKADESRWVSLLGRYPDLFPQRRREVVRLLSASVDRLGHETRVAIWAAIRKLLNQHRRFAGAGWAVPAPDLAPFDPIYDKLTPGDPVGRIAWLFERGEAPLPHPPAGDWQNVQGYEAMVAAERRQAMELLVSSGGPGLVVKLAASVEDPFAVGAAAAGVAMTEDARAALLVECLRDEGGLREAARGMVYGGLCAEGDDWAVRLLDRAVPQGWSTEMVSTVLLMMGRDLRRTWDRVAAFGPEVEAEYWRRLPGPSVMRAAGAEVFGIERLLAAGRGLAAAEGAIHNRKIVPTPMLVEALQLALIELGAVSSPTHEAGNFQYYLEQLLQELDGRPDIEDGEIARLEWGYCPFLRHSGRSLAALHRMMNASPAFFAEAVGLVYRPSPESGVTEQETEATEGRRAMAERAYQLLSSWRGTPGFVDGSIDGGALEQWIKEARRLCREAGCTEVGDQHIGRMLAYAPNEADGVWPAVAVRGAIDLFPSPDIERGIIAGVIEKRGPTWRAVNDGGDQERGEAAKYRRFAEAMRLDWPRTSALLERIGDYYESEGRREDEDVRRRDWS